MKNISILKVGGKVIMSVLACLGVYAAGAQVSGTRTIGIDYPTVAAAINALNTTGISSAVTINVPAGYTETAPAGGYKLGSTLLNGETSAALTLVIKKSGTGADPVLTAPEGTTTTLDGIFTILGTDYVTIDGIDLAEAAGNTTATTWMEWGYGLIKLQGTAPFDGCQNVTIQNCTVTLNIGNTTSVGIYANNHIATSATALTITTATDAMNNCKFYGNTLQNCNTGISLRGYSASSPYTLYDQNNDIGGSSAATANTIQNFAGTASGAAINLRYQNATNVSYNNINNTGGGGASATSSIYGVYAQSGTNNSLDVNNNTINLTQGTTSSSLYGVNVTSGGTGTVNVNNNKFTASGGSSGSMYMIYFGAGSLNINTNGNNFYNINVATTGSLYLVDHSSAASTTNITCSNNFTSGPAVPYISKTGNGGTFAGYYNFASSSAGIAAFYNNNFSNITLAGSPTVYGIDESNGGSGQNKFLVGNIISNITTGTGGTISAIKVGYAATEHISNNRIFNLNAGSGSSYGIYVVNGTTDSIMNNSVHDLTSTTGGNVYGLYIAGGTTVSVYQDTVYALATTGTSGLGYGIWESGPTTMNVYQNKIYGITATGASASVNGIYLNSGTVTAYNNSIGDLHTPTYTGAGGTQLVGIYMGSGTAYNLYYNTVFIKDSSSGTDFGSTAVYANTSPAVTLRNNIFVNTSRAGGAGLIVAYRRSSATLTSYQAASNNNLFYAGTPSAANLVYHDGTTPYPTLAAFKTLVAPRDGNSVTENPPFVSTVGSSASFLNIGTGTPTQVESGGTNITGITTDMYGTIRAGNTGYAGSGTAPDIGMHEGNFMPSDQSAPNIVYTALPSACSTGDRVLTATLTDASGVASGAVAPRIYFKKNTGTWLSATGTMATGTALSGTWNFTISASAMGGLAVGDSVYYFVIAQDAAPATNLGANPGAGLVATSVNAIATYPTNPNVYAVIPSLAGTYNVGVGMTYPTITAAVNAYNTSCISGAVVFQLMDAAYAAETFPITINANVASSAANTLTIRPAAGVSPVISGSGAPAIFVLNGADYVTIDGANSPVANSVCPHVAAGRNMTIANTNTSTSSAVIWLQTAVGSNGATNNTIRNCNIAGNGNTQTLFGIGSGGTSVSYTSNGTGNNNNRIENDSITATQTGIFSLGASAANKNTGTVINQNLLNGTAPGNLRNNGIFTGFEDGIIISGNSIANITNAASNDIIGINLGFGNNASGSSNTTGNDVTNAMVTNNKLDNITQTNTYTCFGIAVAGVTSGTNTIANNMISGVLSNGTSGDFSAGIFIGGAAGGTTNVFYNSVNITGTLTGGNYPSYALCISGSNPVVNLKNNLFVNNGNPGSLALPYAIGLAYTTYTNLSSNRNDFFSIGNNLAMVGSLSGGTAQPTLAAWQSTTGNDANSANTNPTFAASTDLHLTPVGANLPMMNTGTPVSVTTDYDCAVRDAATPDMGINEFTVPLCTSVTAGALAAGTSSFCDSGVTTITATGATSALGINYQWQSSTDSVNWTVINGASTTIYTIAPAITTTTYYRFKVTCTNSGVSDSLGIKISIHPHPVVAVTPDGGGYCSGTGGSVSMTASGALTYSWTPATGLSATTAATVIASPLASTNYVVTGTDGFGCIGTHTSVVTVTTTPPPVIVTPAATTFCSGNSVALSAVDSLPAAIFADSFNNGLAAWTIDNTGSTNTTAIPNTQWTSRADAYSYSSDVFHTPDASQFAMANSDPGGSGSTTHSMLISPAFSLAGYTAAHLTFQHYYRYISSNDQAKVEISTNGGASWTLINNYTTLGVSTGTATSFASANFDLAPYLGNNNCLIRFNFQSSWGWYWAIDNVAITGSGNYNNISWAPVTGLYNDAALSTPYTGGAATTVYAAPVATAAPVSISYIATAANGACSNTGTANVTVNPLPDAGTISGPATVCPGTSIALSDSAAGGVWSSSNPLATIAATGVVTGVAAGSVLISYTVTNSCGSAVATTTVTINPAPDAGAISGPAQVCGGGATINLTENTAGGTWSSSNSAVATIDAAGTLTGAAAGTTVISYTTNNSCGTAVVTATITVNAAPDAGTISGPTAVCAGSGITLTSTVPGGTWTNNNPGLSAVAADGTVTGIAAGTDIITYSVTNGCGTAVAVYPVVINPLPVQYTVTGGGAYCAGGTGVVVGLSGADAGISYQLYNSGNPVGSPVVAQGGAFDFGMQTAAGVYTVAAATAAGCTATMGGSATVIINPTVPPSVSILTSAGSDSVCTSTPTTFTAIVANGGATPVYEWTVNNNVVSNSATYTYTPANGDVVMVTVTGSPCASPNTASASHTITVISYGTPTVMIISNYGTTSCQGFPVTYTAATSYGGATPVLHWVVNGVVAASGNTFTYTPANGDVVYASLVSSFPCRTVDSAVSNTMMMSVTTPLFPTVTLINRPGGTHIAAGQADTIIASVSNSGPLPQYLWSLNGTPVAGATTATYISSTFMDQDFISVYITTTGACSGQHTSAGEYITVGTVGVAQVSGASSSVSLVPNPNKGTFTVKGTLASPADNDVTMEVTDMLGQTVYSKVVTAKNGQLNEQVILGNNLANGMYILNMHTGTERQTFHFVIEQ